MKTLEKVARGGVICLIVIVTGARIRHITTASDNWSPERSGSLEAGQPSVSSPIELHPKNALEAAVLQDPDAVVKKLQDGEDASKIVVEKGSTFTQDGGLDYVQGRVQNHSLRTVNKLTVTASYTDKSGKVIDTQSATLQGPLLPGKSQIFKIKHRHAPNDYHATAAVEENVDFGTK